MNDPIDTGPFIEALRRATSANAQGFRPDERMRELQWQRVHTNLNTLIDAVLERAAQNSKLPQHSFGNAVPEPTKPWAGPMADATKGSASTSAGWTPDQVRAVQRHRRTEGKMSVPAQWPPMTQDLSNLIDAGEVCIRQGRVTINNCQDQAGPDDHHDCGMCGDGPCPAKVSTEAKWNTPAVLRLSCPVGTLVMDRMAIREYMPTDGSGGPCGFCRRPRSEHHGRVVVAPKAGGDGHINLPLPASAILPLGVPSAFDAEGARCQHRAAHCPNDAVDGDFCREHRPVPEGQCVACLTVGGLCDECRTLLPGRAPNAPRCTCGHVEAAHCVTAGWGRTATYGRCGVEGCSCGIYQTPAGVVVPCDRD